MAKRVLTAIVEQRTLLGEGLSTFLNDTSYQVIARASSLAELGGLSLPTGPPALLIVGLCGSVSDTSEAVRKIRPSFPAAKVVIIAEVSGPVDFHDILSSGVDGLVLNVTSRDVLLKALDLAFLEHKLVIVGHELPRHDLSEDIATPSFDGDLAGAIETNGKIAVAPFVTRELSDRERQVLCYLVRGQSNKMIARACSITEATVKVHLKTILRKIAVQNRTQAAVWAVEHGIMVEDLSLPAA